MVDNSIVSTVSNCMDWRLKHGHARRDLKGGWSPEYGAWMRMRRRCSNPNDDRFEHYGGRGIKVCERWANSFENFLEDMGLRPSPRHSLDRVRVNEDYEPLNCRWATPSEQARNTRDAILVPWNGETMPLASVAEAVGIKYHTLRSRLKHGWTLERATKQPVHSRRLAT